jgi:hypothetical protein
MRAAPAVSAPLDDCRPERVLIALLYGGTGAAVAAWAAASAVADGSAALRPLHWLVLGLAMGGAAGWQIARRLLPPGRVSLGWDGQAWALGQRTPSGVVAAIPVVEMRWLIDLGPWLLLRARCGLGRPRWLVVRQQRAGANWHLLRVALMAHARGRR